LEKKRVNNTTPLLKKGGQKKLKLAVCPITSGKKELTASAGTLQFPDHCQKC
jgi:hypothetical protein